jgi:ABC-type transport system involved in cytochrome bd biosynthesis fused ATPase/permease subunit
VPKEVALNLPSYVTDTLSLEERFPANFEKDSNDIRRRKELQMEKVTKYYGLDRALNKFNLNCYEGHVTAIIGEMGAGKSTLLNLVAGINLLNCSAEQRFIKYLFYRNDPLQRRVNCCEPT